MTLIGNYSVLNKTPGRWLCGGATGQGMTQDDHTRPGMTRNIYSSGVPVIDSSLTPAGMIDAHSHVPHGYRPPYCWIMAPKPGGMSTRSSGSGTITYANLAGGRLAAASLTGAGDLAADIQGLLYAAAVLAGAGSLTADIQGLVDAAASLVGSGDLTASINALISGAATLTGSGDLTANGIMALLASATLTGSGDLTADIVGALNAIASLTGSGTLTADIQGALDTAASLAGSGDLVGAITAVANLVATLTGAGDLVGILGGLGNMSALITVAGDLLTVTNVGPAVWATLLAEGVATVPDVNAARDLIIAEVQQSEADIIVEIYAAAGGSVGYLGAVESAIGNQVVLAVSATLSLVDDYYNEGLLLIKSGTGVDQFRRVIDYDGATRTATLASPFAVDPDATSVANIRPFAASSVDSAAIAEIVIAVDAATPADVTAAKNETIEAVHDDRDTVIAAIEPIVPAVTADAAANLATELAAITASTLETSGNIDESEAAVIAAVEAEGAETVAAIGASQTVVVTEINDSETAIVAEIESSRSSLLATILNALSSFFRAKK